MYIEAGRLIAISRSQTAIPNADTFRSLINVTPDHCWASVIARARGGLVSSPRGDRGYILIPFDMKRDDSNPLDIFHITVLRKEEKRNGRITCNKIVLVILYGKREINCFVKKEKPKRENTLPGR